MWTLVEMEEIGMELKSSTENTRSPNFLWRMLNLELHLPVDKYLQ